MDGAGGVPFHGATTRNLQRRQRRRRTVTGSGRRSIPALGSLEPLLLLHVAFSLRPFIFIIVLPVDIFFSRRVAH